MYSKHKDFKQILNIGFLHVKLKQIMFICNVIFFKFLFLLPVVENLFLCNASFVILCYSKEARNTMHENEYTYIEFFPCE